MSARKSKPSSRDRDFSLAAVDANVAAGLNVERAALLAEAVPFDVKRAYVLEGNGRPLLNWLRGDQSALADRPARGRPSDPVLRQAVRRSLLDIHHYDELRLAGWGNVPSNKVVIGKAAEQHWPNQNKDAALKQAVKRERSNRQG